MRWPREPSEKLPVQNWQVNVDEMGKAIATAAFCLAALTGGALAQGQLRFCLRSEPKTFDPLKVEDDASVAIRYLTGGVLVRLNRQTQAADSGLATVVEDLERQQADHVQAAQRSLLFRRHTLFR